MNLTALTIIFIIAALIFNNAGLGAAAVICFIGGI